MSDQCKQVCSIHRALSDVNTLTHTFSGAIKSYIIYGAIHSDDKVDTLLKKLGSGKCLPSSVALAQSNMYVDTVNQLKIHMEPKRHGFYCTKKSLLQV